MVRMTGMSLSVPVFNWYSSKLGRQASVVKEDYRHLKGSDDKIISIEMIEAVGHKFMPGYVQALDRLLKPFGRVALPGHHHISVPVGTG